MSMTKDKFKKHYSMKMQCMKPNKNIQNKSTVKLFS